MCVVKKEKLRRERKDEMKEREGEAEREKWGGGNLAPATCTKDANAKSNWDRESARGMRKVGSMPW